MASPRYRVSVPIVTASEGRPKRVTRMPFTAPAAAPTASTVRMASGIDQPWLHR